MSRFAALMHDVGKPRTRRFLDDGTVTFHHHDVVGAKITRKRMKALRFSNDEIDAVAQLVELHLRFHGYGDGEWTDSAVRRYVRDAGDQLERLHILTRADCTTRNQRKAERLRRTYDDLEERIARLSEEEELASIRPDLDGNQIMEILGIGAGPRGRRGVPASCSSCGWTTARMTTRQATRRAARLVGEPRLTGQSRPGSADAAGRAPWSRGLATDTECHDPVRALLEESIEVQAPPAKVWSLLTDLPRMAAWSPQVVKTVVRGPGAARHPHPQPQPPRPALLADPVQGGAVRAAPRVRVPGQGQPRRSGPSPRADRTAAPGSPSAARRPKASRTSRCG